MRYSKSQIAKALLTAGRLLKGPVQPAAKIAEVLSPYIACSEIKGIEGQAHDDMKSAIFARMADAYRREENVQLAAQWYRRASAISPGDHAITFAYMICMHQLVDFYNDALVTLEAHQRRWLAKPMITRILLRMVRWVKPEARELARCEKHALEFLRQHAMAKAA